jgi:hypothetical protein
VLQRRAVLTLCESSDENKSFFDTLLPKDNDGKICWDKAPQQITDSIFWDKIAKATGQQVGRCKIVLPLSIPRQTTFHFDFNPPFCSFKVLWIRVYRRICRMALYQDFALDML